MRERRYLPGLILLLLGSLPWLTMCRAAPLTSPLPTAPRPTWAALPTRRPSPTPTSVVAEPLAEMEGHLRRGELPQAQRAWFSARRRAREDRAVALSGVRLALAQGHLATAELRAWQAVQAAPHDAAAWALLGITLARRGQDEAAQQALAVAQSLDGSLTEAVFTARWLAARRADDGPAMASLAQVYASLHPDDPLGRYFRAAADVAAGYAQAAVAPLVDALSRQPDAPGVLWFELGQAYGAVGAWPSAEAAYRAARERFAQGDRSFTLAVDTLPDALDLALARAELEAGDCVAAAEHYRALSTSHPALAGSLSRAILCQTPTPTWTPWLPSAQQGTPMAMGWLSPTPSPTP